ncbi:alpha/beta hydrolase [Microbacteriaceae bacterium 4G12]
MNRESFTLQSADGIELHIMKWYDSSVQPKAVVQIAHGMAEHIKRYDEFARELVSNGIFVYGNDHRGHGLTASCKEDRGYFAPENGFERVVHDMDVVSKHIENEYDGVPLFLLGHSMGSFLSRRYVQIYGKRLKGLILTGTGDNPSFMLKVGKAVARFEMRKNGHKTPSPLLNAMSFGQFNRAFRPNRTLFDWLSRDEKAVDAYLQDSLCGGVFTSGFFYDLFTGSEMIIDEVSIARVPKDLPIFFVSGDRDPVGKNTKGVLHAYEAYKKAGVQDVSYKFYKDSRHEILNETNRAEVYEEILAWIVKRLG